MINIGCFDISNKFVKHLDKDTEYIWWLDALKLKEKADFEGAIKIIELNLNKVPIPYSNKLSKEKIYLRPFLSKEADIKMGSYLLSKALSEKNLIQASKIIDHLMDLEHPPLFVYYWKAKILYMQGYFVETWFAYESYINKSKLRNNKIILN